MICPYCKNKNNKSGIEFYQTQMGQRYYNGTLPKLIKEIGKLAEIVEVSPDAKKRLLKNIEKMADIGASDNFFQTIGGKRYYEQILPKLIKEMQELRAPVE